MEPLLELIVSDMYGEQSARVVHSLLLHGALSLQKLLDFSELPLEDVRNVLVALIQQNLIQVSDYDTPKYILRKEEILARNRFPKYIRLTQGKYGDLGIAEAVLENGSLTTAELIDQISPGRKPAAVKRAVTEMIAAEYLLLTERVTLPTLPKPEKRKLPPILVKIGRKKAKKEQVEETEEVKVESQDAGGFYRLNFKKLDRELMGQLIAGLVETKVNPQAAVVAEVMFYHGYDHPLTPQQILSHLPPVPKLSESNVLTCLDLLQRDSSEFVIAKTADSFVLNLPEIVGILRKQTVEKMLGQRFGEYAARIFKIIIGKGFLNERILSDLSLLPARETQACLNELFREGIIVTQEVPGKGLFYGIRFGEVCAQMSRSLLQGMFNLKVRLKSEIKEAWDLMHLSGVMSAEEKQKLAAYKEIEIKIESALLELDRTYMLLDFPV